MIIKTNAPLDSANAGTDKERFRREVNALLDRAELELAELKPCLSIITADDHEACAAFEGFAQRLARSSEALDLGVLASVGLDLEALVETRHRHPTPAAKFRFLLFTSLELIAIEIRRVRSLSSN